MLSVTGRASHSDQFTRTRYLEADVVDDRHHHHRRFGGSAYGQAPAMIALRSIPVALAVAGVSFVGCASDEAPTPLDTPEEQAPVDSTADPTANDGIDTNVERSGNLGFDEEDT